ncbi:MAG: hypothetical protein WBM24_11360 [Candidatus Sulfotelmatobacter sp.]
MRIQRSPISAAALFLKVVAGMDSGITQPVLDQVGDAVGDDARLPAATFQSTKKFSAAYTKVGWQRAFSAVLFWNILLLLLIRSHQPQ